MAMDITQESSTHAHHYKYRRNLQGQNLERVTCNFEEANCILFAT